MKSYDKIPQWKAGHFGERCIAFDKPDGSNMRFEWSRKKCKQGGLHLFADDLNAYEDELA